jgi:purine-binding chemotaxis protein CheW
MEDYLIFRVGEDTFALNASLSLEIIWLPYLSPYTGSEGSYIATFPYRGDLIPVMDFSLWNLGHLGPYDINDRLLILSVDGSVYALRISDVVGVYPLDTKNEEQIYFQNHYVSIISLEKLKSIINSEKLTQMSPYEIWATINQNLLPQEKLRLEDRRDSYSTALKIEDESGVFPLAIMRVGENLFGVELENILEFADVMNYSQIPCTPSHIAGCMNLRGDILPLLDFQYWIESVKMSELKDKKVAVVKENEKHFGVLVNELLDVIYIQKQDIKENPSLLKNSANLYTKGVIIKDGRKIGILNMDAIINKPDLIVEEYV